MTLTITDLCAIAGILVVMTGGILSWVIRIERRLGRIEVKIERVCGPKISWLAREERGMGGRGGSSGG